MKNEKFDLIETPDGSLALYISEGVNSLDDLGYDAEFDRATAIHFPASMEEIPADLQWQFMNLEEYHVHPESPYFTEEDGVIFSKDKKKIIKYSKSKEGESYTVDDSVEEIADGCFFVLDHLKHVYIGKGVKKIGHCALGFEYACTLEKVYIPSTVAEFVGEIFDRGVDDNGDYYPIGIVGGVRGSAIEEYCNRRGIDFVEFPEDDVASFYAATVDELRERARQQDEAAREFQIDESDRGYWMRFLDGTLEISASEDCQKAEIAVAETRNKLNKNRRKRVKTLKIGNGITAIKDFAFDDYENLESIFLGRDVRSIAPNAFRGKNQGNSCGCCAVATVAVEENNGWYQAKDGVVYTADMQTLVFYAPAKSEAYHQVDRRVRRIGGYAFEETRNLQCLYVGEGCVSVGEGAFLNASALRHAYFAASVVEWQEEGYPFAQAWGRDLPWVNDGLVIGGPRGSAVEAYCAARRMKFHVVEEDGVSDFLAVPLPSEEEDRYLLTCEVAEVKEDLKQTESVSFDFLPDSGTLPF